MTTKPLFSLKIYHPAPCPSAPSGVAECPEESEQGSGEEPGQWTAQKELVTLRASGRGTPDRGHRVCVCVCVCVCVVGWVVRQPGAAEEEEGREESWRYPKDLWASSLSFGLLICGNRSVDLSRQGLGSGLRAISM